MIITRFVSVIILGYLLGSVPSGVLVARLFSRVDVRDHGSGKMGATNVLRTAGAKAAVIVVILDILKGAVAVIAARLIIDGHYLIVGNVALGSLAAQILAGLAAIVGHIWPVFVKFKGGRGVATFFGGLVVLCPAAAVFGGEVLIIGAGLTQFASLGSIAGVIGTYTILIPLTILNGFRLELLIYALIGAIIIIVMHRGNIARLISGRERKLGDRLRAAQSPPVTKKVT